ncbi:MAG: hypothetical protein M1812_002349 [Candelaria pacifica]|nr:MAG: hypothetical protein M1812_002349 [Candelaria pacifica]
MSTGSLSPKILFRLAQKHHMNLPSPTEDPAFFSASTLLERYERFSSLDDFLHYYFIGMSVLLEAGDFELLAWEYFLQAHADGVCHAEVFFDAQAHTDRGVTYSAVIEGFVSACRRAEEELGMSTNLILCFLRHLPPRSAEQTFETARYDLQSGKIAGIGLDSSEKGFPPQIFRTVYASAKELGIRRTAHAGEEGDVSSIRDALDVLDIQRIDHGIRLADDQQLMNSVAARKILVTVCPLSNVRLKCVGSVAELPLKKFLDAGIQFSINSDDPAYFGGYILDNYCAVQDAFKLSEQEWIGIARASIEGSWCSTARKTEMMKMLPEAGAHHVG